MTIFHSILRPLTCIDQAVLSVYLPFRRVVKLVDYGHGMENHILRLKGHVITFQTNFKQRLASLKTSLFRFNLDKEYYVIFFGEKRFFKIAEILNSGECFRNLLCCDIRNLIAWAQCHC